MSRIILDPVTRIEGHLKLELTVDDGIVKEAACSGTLFRGIELILAGRDPLDARHITQRICGVCPTSHSMAAALTLDDALGIKDSIPDNGRILRNLILGAAHLSDHILHFYHLAALDYVDISKAAAYDGTDPAIRLLKAFLERGEASPFFPRYEGDYRLSPEADRELVGHYLQALTFRRKGHELLAVFAGRAPHNPAIVPGGVSEPPTVDKMASFLWRLNEISDFIDNVYIPDVLTVATAYGDYFETGRGCGNLLSFGGFDLDSSAPGTDDKNRLMASGTVSNDLELRPLDPAAISESVAHSWYNGSESGPTQGDTMPDENRQNAYSWVKAPRYEGKVYEVGPLARMLATFLSGGSEVKSLVDSALSAAGIGLPSMFSVLGRHLARALYAKVLADAMKGWVLRLQPGEPICAPFEVPDESRGAGMLEGARGALGHWIEIRDKRIARYQCVVPSTWNMSPKDERGVPGPVEQALIGTRVRDEANPFEIVRTVRSFDPCLACAVHMATHRGRKITKFRLG